MLRLIHTADWHLGQSFHQYERDYEHARFLEWLLGALAEKKPDALLLSGDVFDSVNPPASAQRRYYQFLHKAKALLPNLQIVVTAGNHDAAARLEAPAELLENLNIMVVGTVARDQDDKINFSKFIIPLKNATGEVAALILAVPFLRPSEVPLVTDVADPYLEGIRELYHNLTRQAVTLRDQSHPGASIVAMGHCHMQDTTASNESERRIVIGGAEALKADIFEPEIAYVALGHLHKPQQLNGGRIRYSGSPLPLSFSEKDYPHQVLEVVLDGAFPAVVNALPIPKAVALVRLPAGPAVPLVGLLQQLRDYPSNAELPPELHPFLEVRVLDDGPDPTRRTKIEAALSGKSLRLASLKMEPLAKNDAVENSHPAQGLADLGSLDPIEIMIAAHKERYQNEPAPEVIFALQALLREVAL